QGERNGDPGTTEGRAVETASSTSETRRGLDETGSDGNSQRRIFQLRTRKIRPDFPKNTRTLWLQRYCEAQAGKRSGDARVWRNSRKSDTSRPVLSCVA